MTSLTLPAPTTDRDRTVSRRSEPSSRAAFMGEQPNPWDLLQPQDATSRHRGAKPCRRFELLGKISLLSPGYLLSVDQRPFHSAPLGHYARLSSLLGLCASQSSSLVPLHSVRVVSIHPEGTFGRLRYCLGGDRPSQTTRLALSGCPFLAHHETQNRARVVFHCCLPTPHKEWFSGSHLSYACTTSHPGQGVVKLHGVFLSCRG